MSESEWRMAVRVLRNATDASLPANPQKPCHGLWHIHQHQKCSTDFLLLFGQTQLTLWRLTTHTGVVPHR